VGLEAFVVVESANNNRQFTTSETITMKPLGLNNQLEHNNAQRSPGENKHSYPLRASIVGPATIKSWRERLSLRSTFFFSDSAGVIGTENW